VNEFRSDRDFAGLLQLDVPAEAQAGASVARRLVASDSSTVDANAAADAAAAALERLDVADARLQACLRSALSAQGSTLA